MKCDQCDGNGSTDYAGFAMDKCSKCNGTGTIMSADEQEAMSHQHSHGFWLVPLSSGAFAVFEHPVSTKVRHILFNTEELHWFGNKCFERYEIAMRKPLAYAPIKALKLDTEGIL